MPHHGFISNTTSFALLAAVYCGIIVLWRENSVLMCMQSCRGFVAHCYNYMLMLMASVVLATHMA